ncbi:hypothetical protein DF268_37770 [Streptomyces sp. V2]|nr:hypothetical protein DF268_37770 [Streptomyces sp. V2]
MVAEWLSHLANGWVVEGASVGWAVAEWFGHLASWSAPGGWSVGVVRVAWVVVEWLSHSATWNWLSHFASRSPVGMNASSTNHGPTRTLGKTSPPQLGRTGPTRSRSRRGRGFALVPYRMPVMWTAQWPHIMSGGNGTPSR